MQRNILTLKFLKVQSKTHLSIEHWVFTLPSTVEVRHLNRQRPRVQAGALMLVPFRTLGLMCSLSTPPGNERGECRLCLWPRERASSCVLTERKQSWVARWCPVNVRQQACFTDCLYFLCALPDDASAPHIGFCLNGVGSVGRVPVTKATKCYAFSTQCVLFFK